MTKTQELEGSLHKLLSTLKKNREMVPLKVLKSSYQQPYEALIRQIGRTATAFVKAVLTDRLILNPDVSIEEQAAVINQVIAASGMERQMSACISRTYSTEQLYQMALELRRKIEHALWPYINLKTCLVWDWNRPDQEPVIYNTLTRQVFWNNTWIEQEISLQGKALIYGDLNETLSKEILTKKKENEENEHEYQNRTGNICTPVEAGNRDNLPQTAASLLGN